MRFNSQFQEDVGKILQMSQLIKLYPGRPNDGDLIWFPLNETVFEIKYVENQKPFYQVREVYIHIQ